MLQIPGIQVSVYAIPVWLVVMYAFYMLKSKRSGQASGAAGSVAK